MTSATLQAKARKCGVEPFGGAQSFSQSLRSYTEYSREILEYLRLHLSSYAVKTTLEGSVVARRRPQPPRSGRKQLPGGTGSGFGDGSGCFHELHEVDSERPHA